ncbi:OmpA family protein [Neolewinella lacunae]|uniref:PD40 domain-containing protein n=1 Tax=Neolewinella lacunae TaxID=1517758 RepID=A0A923PLS8_9BACT|nr:OmpA family protein [Neolewinella lacunae]MBC6992857.1 PD40 domain-containing protein [Neolewinella lacunae]MDN3633779.1 OmpA family protein [Neolewinella lacunae]
MLSYRSIVLLLLCLQVATASAQWVSKSAEAKGAFDDGVNFLLAGKAQKAAKSFRAATKLDTSFTAAYRFLGTAEELQRNYPAAAEAYQTVIARDSTFSRLLYYQLGKVYYKMSRPALALHYLQMFQRLQAQDRGVFGRNGEEEAQQEAAILKKLDREIQAAQITQDSSQFINVTEIHNLGTAINTNRDDYFPFFSNDLSSVLFTRMGQGNDEDLIRGSRRNLDGTFTTARFGSFNTLEPEGMCTLVRDGERIYFTLCHGNTSRGGCDLYAGWLIDGKIERVEPLPDYVNAESWDSQPAISCDGQQLFFASIRPGGFGGSDIYRCIKRPDGTWSEPQNLGSGVNTPEDEEGPFLSNDGGTLYFASMGHSSLGDQDIFVSYWDKTTNRFTQAMNLGPPVNGPHRELGFHLTSDGKTGYFASDRPGGLGGLDIYSFKLSDKLSGRPITYVAGYVTDSLTGEPITDQAISLANGQTYYTNFGGRFFICAPSEAALPLQVVHPDYLPYQRVFGIPAWDNFSTYRIDLLLAKAASPPPPPPPVAVPPPPTEPEPIPEDTIQRKTRLVTRSLPVNFNFDDASLTPRQIESISLFVEQLKGKTLLNIVITGYTDDIGDAGYNIKLSQNRAKAVGIHLQTAGLKANEIKIVGLGELPGSSMRALNRRVEIEVRYREIVEIE